MRNQRILVRILLASILEISPAQAADWFAATNRTASDPGPKEPPPLKVPMNGEFAAWVAEGGKIFFCIFRLCCEVSRRTFVIESKTEMAGALSHGGRDLQPSLL